MPCVLLNIVSSVHVEPNWNAFIPKPNHVFLINGAQVKIEPDFDSRELGKPFYLESV